MGAVQIATQIAETSQLTTEAGVGVAPAKEDPPNPVLPTTNEIFWSAVFFILFWMLMKYVLLPPIRAIQKKRAEEIDASKDAVDSLEDNKAKLTNDYEAAIQVVRQEAAQLVDEGRQRAERYRSEVMSVAEAEVAELKAKNEAELEKASKEMMSLLQDTIQDLTSEAVETILGEAPNKKSLSDHLSPDHVGKLKL